MTDATNTPTRFADVARPLWHRGYRPIPLRPDTKVPVIKGWNVHNRLQWRETPLRETIARYPDHACGYAVPANMCAVDFDILDQSICVEVVNTAQKILGVTRLVRVGFAPKMVLIWRSDGTTRSRKAHPVEVFSGTGQVALFGYHQKAGRPYLWPRTSPLDIDAHDKSIPMATGALVDEFLTTIELLLVEYRAEQARKSGIRVGSSKNLGVWSERWRELQVHGATQAALTIAKEATATGAGRHDAFFFIVNQWVREKRSADELVYMLERAVPDFMAHVDAGDDYSGRVVAYARDKGQESA